MNFLLRSLLIALASLALLTGIQVPGFVDQYAKRVDAHLIEARHNFRPFQQIADQYHQGSIEKLIERHQLSDDDTFRAEASAIQQMRDRVRHLQRQALALDTDLAHRVMWMATDADREILDETRRSYSFGIVLDRTTVIFGIVCMVLVVLLMEGLGGLLRALKPRQNQLFK